MLLLLPLACIASPPPVLPPEEVADTGVPPEQLPDNAPRALSGPASATLDCPADVPVDGKIDCALSLWWPEGDVAYAGTAGVGLHGRSSAGFPKKQYAVELRDAAGADLPVDLFGMGAEADWLLNGMYLDRALFRNKLAYDLYAEMGNVAPQAVYVDVVLNGAPSGVYLLTERIEHGRDRVDQPDDDGTGASFVVKADEAGIASNVQYAHWSPVYPEAPAPAGVAARLASFEAAILAEPDRIFEEADLDGYVDFVILEELLKNNDAYFLSHHLYTDDDGALRFIPWDLDLTLGQPSYNNNELSDQWILYRPDLIARPARDEAFRARLVERWTELRGGLLATDTLLARLHGYRAFLGASVDANWAIWDITSVPNVGFPLYGVASAEEEYAHIDAWLTARLLWIDASIGAY